MKKVTAIAICMLMLFNGLPIFAQPQGFNSYITESFASQKSALVSSGWTFTDTKGYLSVADGMMTISPQTAVLTQATKAFAKSSDATVTQIKLRLRYSDENVASNIGIQIFDGESRAFLQLSPKTCKVQKYTGSTSIMQECENFANENGVWYTYKIVQQNSRISVYRKTDGNYVPVCSDVPIPANTGNAMFKIYCEKAALSADVDSVEVGGEGESTQDGSFTVNTTFTENFDETTLAQGGWSTSSASIELDSASETLHLSSGGLIAAQSVKRNIASFDMMMLDMRFKLCEASTQGLAMGILRADDRGVINFNTNGTRYRSGSGWVTASASYNVGVWYDVRIEITDSTYALYRKSSTESAYSMVFSGAPLQSFASARAYLNLYIEDTDAAADVSIDYINYYSGIALSQNEYVRENFLTNSYELTQNGWSLDYDSVSVENQNLLLTESSSKALRTFNAEGSKLFCETSIALSSDDNSTLLLELCDGNYTFCAKICKDKTELLSYDGTWTEYPVGQNGSGFYEYYIEIRGGKAQLKRKAPGAAEYTALTESIALKQSSSAAYVSFESLSQDAEVSFVKVSGEPFSGLPTTSNYSINSKETADFSDGSWVLSDGTYTEDGILYVSAQSEGATKETEDFDATIVDFKYRLDAQSESGCVIELGNSSFGGMLLLGSSSTTFVSGNMSHKYTASRKINTWIPCKIIIYGEKGEYSCTLEENGEYVFSEIPLMTPFENAQITIKTSQESIAIRDMNIMNIQKLESPYYLESGEDFPAEIGWESTLAASDISFTQSTMSINPYQPFAQSGVNKTFLSDNTTLICEFDAMLSYSDAAACAGALITLSDGKTQSEIRLLPEKVIAAQNDALYSKSKSEALVNESDIWYRYRIEQSLSHMTLLRLHEEGYDVIMENVPLRTCTDAPNISMMLDGGESAAYVKNVSVSSVTPRPATGSGEYTLGGANAVDVSHVSQDGCTLPLTDTCAYEFEISLNDGGAVSIEVGDNTFLIKKNELLLNGEIIDTAPMQNDTTYTYRLEAYSDFEGMRRAALYRRDKNEFRCILFDALITGADNAVITANGNASVNGATTFDGVALSRKRYLIDKETVSALREASKLTFAFDLSSSEPLLRPKAQNIEWTAIIALYDSSGRLVKANIEPLAQNKTAIDLLLPVTSDAYAGYCVKTFIWKSTDSMTPITQSSELSNNGK